MSNSAPDARRRHDRGTEAVRAAVRGLALAGLYRSERASPDQRAAPRHRVWHRGDAWHDGRCHARIAGWRIAEPARRQFRAVGQRVGGPQHPWQIESGPGGAFSRRGGGSGELFNSCASAFPTWPNRTRTGARDRCLLRRLSAALRPHRDRHWLTDLYRPTARVWRRTETIRPADYCRSGSSLPLRPSCRAS